MSTTKPVLGFDDNLSTRAQELAPTMYAIGKLRAARTPYGATGLLINNANSILRPGLYVMEINANTTNVNGYTSGTMYIYQISVDPDESIHGGHAADTASLTNMNIRQIAYYQQGTAGKVITRTGRPLTSYTGNTVNLLTDVANASTALVFVKEIGMWVTKSPLQLAVTWGEWKEFGGGSNNPAYTFVTDIVNGVGFSVDGNNVSVVASSATYDTFGVIKTIDTISNIQDATYSNYVPNTNAVYNAIGTVSQTVDLVSSIAADVADALQDHLENHPTTQTASYTVNGTTLTATRSGTVLTTPFINSVNAGLEEAKHTVPTINALWSASSALSAYISNTSGGVSNYIDMVSQTLTDHVTNATIHGGGGEGTVTTDGVVSYNELDGGVKQIVLKWNSAESNGVALKSNTNGELIASARPASYDYYGTIKTVTTLADDSTRVPTAKAVWSALTAHTGNTAIHGGGGGGGMGFPYYGSAGSFSVMAYNGTPMQLAGQGTIVRSGTAGSNGCWLLISILCVDAAQGCVGVGINGTFIPLEGGRAGATTKLIPITPDASWTVYNNGGAGTTVDVRVLPVAGT